MKSKTSKLIVAFIFSILGISLVALTPIAHAAGDVCSQSEGSVPKAVWEAAGCNDDTADALPGLIVGIINGIIAVSGLVAVIFVVIGGINYMTSAGDANKLQKAKQTILYAVIGMTIAVLSFAIVNFVILNIIGGNEPESSQEESEEEIIKPNDNQTNGSKQETQ